MSLGSPELYDLDPECVPDVLGLHARRSEAPVAKVMLRRDSIRVLIPDDDVGFQGFHDVMLFDRMEDDAPYVAVSFMSRLRTFTVQADTDVRLALKWDSEQSSSLWEDSDMQRDLCRRPSKDVSPRCKFRRALSPCTRTIYTTTTSSAAVSTLVPPIGQVF